MRCVGSSTCHLSDASPLSSAHTTPVETALGNVKEVPLTRMKRLNSTRNSIKCERVRVCVCVRETVGQSARQMYWASAASLHA